MISNELRTGYHFGIDKDYIAKRIVKVIYKFIGLILLDGFNYINEEIGKFLVILLCYFQIEIDKDIVYP